jgi:hypothetical protein
MRPALPALLGLLVLLAGPVSAQTAADCMRQAEEGTQRVEREMARQAPHKSDTAAYQRWSRTVHEQLAAVKQRHEDCRRGAQSRANPQAASKEMACAQTSMRQYEELRVRYANRTLSAAEQKAQRDEETAILDARHSCTLKAAKG